MLTGHREEPVLGRDPRTGGRLTDSSADASPTPRLLQRTVADALVPLARVPVSKRLDRNPGVPSCRRASAGNPVLTHHRDKREDSTARMSRPDPLPRAWYRAGSHEPTWEDQREDVIDGEPWTTKRSCGRSTLRKRPYTKMVDAEYGPPRCFFETSWGGVRGISRGACRISRCRVGQGGRGCDDVATARFAILHAI